MLHLNFKCFVHFDVNVVASRLLGVGSTVNTANVARVSLHTQRVMNTNNFNAHPVITATGTGANRYSRYTADYSPDDVVDDDRIWRLQQLVEATRNLIKLHPCALKYLKQQNVLIQCHKAKHTPLTLP